MPFPEGYRPDPVDVNRRDLNDAETGAAALLARLQWYLGQSRGLLTQDEMKSLEATEATLRGIMERLIK